MAHICPFCRRLSGHNEWVIYSGGGNQFTKRKCESCGNDIHGRFRFTTTKRNIPISKLLTLAKTRTENAKFKKEFESQQERAGCLWIAMGIIILLALLGAL